MYKKNYKLFLVVIAMVLMVSVALTGCGTKQAEQPKQEAPKYPERPVEVIVGWGAGGGTDVFARSLTKPLSNILGQPMPVKNMPGASATVAADYVAQQPADGYTVWAMTSTCLPVNVALGRAPHPADTYIPVARLQDDVGMLHVNANSPLKTIEDVIEYAKKNNLKVGGTGAVSHDEVVVALWADAAGIPVTYVPYERAGDMHAALMGGHIDAMYEEMGPVAGLVKAGNIKPVLAFSKSKIRGFDDLPIAPDKGWNITLGLWRGIMVKKGTPDHVVKALQAAIEKAKDDPEYKAMEAERYLDLVPGYLKGDDFKKNIEDSINTYISALKKLGHIK
ncbi:MAG: tripartite tricarboxylate transporter substrate binding protein [Bacillota bacterium]